MFFNCCKRSCCCRQNNSNEKNCYDKYEYNKCDKQDNNKCDRHQNKYDKCEYEKNEKCCCHINIEKKSCWDNDKRDEKFDSYYNNNDKFNGQGYYNEYNNLGYFNLQNGYGRDEIIDRKIDKKEDDYRNCNFDKNCYTPNWDCDRECKCEKDKNDKCDKQDNKYCKPVKYICIPCDKF